MADTKITGLQPPQPGYAIVPSTDVLPIVVIADPGMAASGSTRKATVNQILGAGGTATLASATITGDLTAQNNIYVPGNVSKKIGPVGSTWGGLRFDSTNQPFLDSDIGITFRTGGSTSFTTSYVIGATGISTWSVGGSTAMTLNSTGLGVGISPSVKLDINGDIKIRDTFSLFMGFGNEQKIFVGGGANSTYLTFNQWTGSAYTERMRIDSSGNVGVGVTPSTYTAGFRALEINAKGNSLLSYSNDNVYLNENAYYNGAWKYGSTATAGQYVIFQGTHRWNIAPSGTIDTNITFTQAMTLTAGGDLLVGTVTSPSGAKVGAITKLSGVSLEGTASINVSTTPVVLSRVTGLSGLFFVQGYNTSGGAQGWWLVASTGGGTPTVIASGNSTGLTVTFTMVAGALNMNTASGTVAVNAFNITG